MTDLDTLLAAGFTPSPRPGWWIDASASGEEYPEWRAVEIARGDVGARTR